MVRQTLAAIVLAWVLIFAPAAVAASHAVAARCQPRDDMLALLARKYDETIIARGIGNIQVMVELLATENGDTWTILMTGRDGISCVMMVGQGWQEMPRGTAT